MVLVYLYLGPNGVYFLSYLVHLKTEMETILDTQPFLQNQTVNEVRKINLKTHFILNLRFL
jgi:hypothetical protein